MALSAEEELVVREWAPLNYLFQKLPCKHPGIFSSDLKLTCMDVVSELIVLGTNQGIIYCFDRNTHNLERLKCENVHSPVTCIKVISTVDYMLACGNKDGNINIFQIPKIPSESLPVSLRPREKQVERYTVSEMHKGHVTALEWSKNGMKLFSGDFTGHVVLTEIDFYLHLCKSSEILDEAYEIIQLNYLQQRLLVSTTYRSIICQKQDRWKVCQVGKKDRKVLGRFGGTILQNGLRPTDLVLYCARPGLRIWQAQLTGDVEKTVLFKDSLNDGSPEVFTLNPMPSNLRRQHPAEPSFGIMHQFFQNYLVTFNMHVVYILNVKNLKIVGQISHLRGILDVSVHKDEIFILEGERSLIRISPTPEIDTPIQRVSTSNTNPLTTSLRELTNKLQSSSIITAEPTKSALPLRSSTGSNSIVTAEEALEASKSPNKIRNNGGHSDEVYHIYRKLEVYNKISKQDYDDVIQITHKKKKKQQSNQMTGSMCSFSSNSSDERDFTIKPTLMNISTVGLISDVKSPDSLQHDIAEKENLLAEILNFDSVKIDLNGLETSTKSDNVLNKDLHLGCDMVLERENLEKFVGEMDTRPEVDQVEHLFTQVKQEQSGMMPACKALPNTWTVNKVNVNDAYHRLQLDAIDSHIDSELADWEIV